MSLTIELTPEEEARLREAAARENEEPARYARKVLLEKLWQGLPLPKEQEITAPLHNRTTQSGAGKEEVVPKPVYVPPPTPKWVEEAIAAKPHANEALLKLSEVFADIPDEEWDRAIADWKKWRK